MDHLAVQGSVDLSAIEQEAQAASATGEGMAEFLDTGLLDADVGIWLSFVGPPAPAK